MILITGAAGKTGRAVIEALKKRGGEVKAFVRNQDQASLSRESGAKEWLIGDLLSDIDLKLALEGIDTVYHICPNMHPDEISIGKSLISACLGKAQRIVYHSVFHPQIEAMPHHWNKLRVEEALIGSGLNFTILQPTAYMQNVLPQIEQIKRQGVYRVPYSVETRVSMVDLVEVAGVAADSLMDDKYSSGTYELVSPGYFSQLEIAEIFSDKLHQKVTAEEIPLEDWRKGAEENGLGDYQIESLIKMFKYYDQYSFQGNSKTLENLLKKIPTNFEGFLDRELQSINLNNSLLA